MNGFLEKCEALAEKHQLFRRSMLVSTVILTWWAVHFSFNFALVSKFDGLGTAAVIGAILLPVNGLMGVVFKWYTEARNGQ
ncbi:MAG: hypothetical protein ACREJC_01965 [Tepidisphaeraceae bacterium]